MALTPTPQRQLDIGPAAWFRPEPLDPAANQVRVKAGFGFAGSDTVYDKFTGGDQLTVGFSVVSAGTKRYDLVYIDLTGTVQVAQGVEVLTASAFLDGAPGQNNGPPMPVGSPVAYVLIDETASVIVDYNDIWQVNGFIALSRDLDGYRVDKGLFGSAPSGMSDDVSAMFAAETRIQAPAGTVVPNSGGSSTQVGIVTTSPANYVQILDQAGDEIENDLAAGAKVYGRITEAAGVWTLSYYYKDASGAEQTVDPSTLTPAPTDVHLVGVPKVFSRNDPNRPLFTSEVYRVSDQVAGDIPDGTEAQKGKVQFAANLDTASLEAVQGNDSRVNTPIQAEDSGGNPVGTRFSHLKAGANITLSDAGGGRVGIAAAGAAAGVTSLSPGAKTGAVNLTSGAGMSVADAGGQNISITRSAPRVRGHFTATASCGPSASAVFNHGLGGSLGDYQITGMVTNDNGHDPVLNTPYFVGVSGGIFCGRIHNITTATVWMRNDNAATGMTGRVNVTRIA